MAASTSGTTPAPFTFASTAGTAPASQAASPFGGSTGNSPFSFAPKPAGDAPKPAFSFGPAATAPATPAPNSFGGFSLNATPNSSAPSLNASTTPAQTPAPSLAFAGFGAKPAQATSTPPAANTPAPLFSFASSAPATPAATASAPKPAFSFGSSPASANPPIIGNTNNANPPASATSTANPASETKTAPTFSLGSNLANPKKPSPLGANSPVFPASPSVPSTTGSASTTLQTPALSFGTPAAASASTNSNANTKPAVSTPSFGAAPASTAPASSGTPALPSFGKAAANSTENNSAVATTRQPSVLSGMRLDEIVNRWTTDLDERVKEFMNLAVEVKAWDAILIANGDQISDLYTQLQQTEPTQQKIATSLDYVDTQQKELSTILDSYERQVDDILGPADSQSYLVGADAERERAYRLAESLNTQLDEMSRSLSALIQDVNALSRSTGLVATSTENGRDDENTADPVAQIAAILNAHLSGLQWIESTSAQLRTQIDEIEGKVKNVSRGQWNGLKSRSAASPRRQNTPSRSLYSYGRQ